MYDIYQFTIYKAPSVEEWVLQKINTLATIEEAKRFVIDRSLQESHLREILMYISKEDTPHFLEMYLFDNNVTDWLAHRRYFVGKPDINKLVDTLETNKINVINNIKQNG